MTAKAVAEKVRRAEELAKARAGVTTMHTTPSAGVGGGGGVDGDGDGDGGSATATGSLLSGALANSVGPGGAGSFKHQAALFL